MKKRIALSLFCATLACAGHALAQVSTVAGEVIKLDKPGGRITLKQGEIKSLDMPPMTMVWRLRTPAALDELAIGDRVRFVPERVDGQYIITTINKAPQ